MCHPLIIKIPDFISLTLRFSSKEIYRSIISFLLLVSRVDCYLIGLPFVENDLGSLSNDAYTCIDSNEFVRFIKLTWRYLLLIVIEKDSDW